MEDGSIVYNCKKNWLVFLKFFSNFNWHCCVSIPHAYIFLENLLYFCAVLLSLSVSFPDDDHVEVETFSRDKRDKLLFIIGCAIYTV
jgi:hypothetical protein